MDKPQKGLYIPILESRRIILKPLNKAFISKDYVNWMNDFDVIKFMNSGGDYTLEKLKNYLEKVENEPQYFWAIVSKKSNTHIGNIKIDPVDNKNRFGEYGIMLGDRNFQGKGFASEASRLVIKFCFEKLYLRKINLGVMVKNKNAINLYKSLGFSVEGKFKKHIFHRGNFEDIIRMATFNNNLT